MDLLLRRYFWVVNLTVTGLCAALVGRAASHQFEGAYLNGDDGRAPAVHRPSAPAPKPHTRDIDALVKRDPFCSSCTLVVAKDPGDKSAAPTSNELGCAGSHATRPSPNASTAKPAPLRMPTG